MSEGEGEGEERGARSERGEEARAGRS